MSSHDSQPVQTQSLSGVVSGGMAWMVLATMVAKFSSLLAQIVLGVILLKEDFGVYAIAISVTVILQVIREGGTRKVLLQKGIHRFDKLVCPVFWLALLFNLLSAGAMIIAAPVVAKIYSKPELAPMLIVISLGVMTSTHGSIYRTKLAAQLRYRELAKMRSMVVFLRNLSLVMFAVLGFGAMSFAWPFLIASLVEWGIGLWMCGRLHLLRSPRFRLWPKLFGVSSWMLVSTLALAVINQSPYAIVGYYVPSAILGVYYFGSQLVLQIIIVFAGNLQDVLLPTLSSMNNSRQRQIAAIVRAVRALVFVGSCIAFGIASVISEIEYLFWGGKWADAVPAIQWMCVFIPFRILQGLIEPMMLARSSYKLNALLLGIQALIVGISAYVAGVYFHEPWEFAAIVGGGYAISIVLAGAIGCNRLDIPWWKCFHGFVPPWILGIACFVFVLWIKGLVFAGDETGKWQVGIHLIAAGSLFTFAFAICSRLFLRKTIEEAVGILPRKIRTLAQRAAMLPSS